MSDALQEQKVLTSQQNRDEFKRDLDRKLAEARAALEREQQIVNEQREMGIKRIQLAESRLTSFNQFLENHRAIAPLDDSKAEKRRVVLMDEIMSVKRSENDAFNVYVKRFQEADQAYMAIHNEIQSLADYEAALNAPE